MAISEKTSDLLKKVYEDNIITPAEIMEIRDYAKEMRDSIADLEGADSNTVLFLDSLNEMAETMQERMLEIRKGDYTDLGKMQLLSSIENYVALIKANFDAFKS
ncbi:MAG: hypothetical protein CMM99_05935 [Rickettsiales bacterium]|nr:hypothetical protein [Rickettsiales bacterium]